MKQLITQSQNSRSMNKNRERCEIPREYLEMVCYNVGGLGDKIDVCKYSESQNCPGECGIFDVNAPNFQNGMQRFTTKYGENWRG